MSEDFAVEVTRETLVQNIGRTELSRESLEKHFYLPDLEIVGIGGLCAADAQNPERPRERKWYIENVLNPMIARGEIGDGVKTKFDDRKLRLDYTYLVANINAKERGGWLKIGFGATHYKAFREDIGRTWSGNLEFQQRGVDLFNDRYAFFSRAPGVAGLVISSDGSIFVGERVENNDDSGKLNAVAGHLTFKEDPTTISLKEDLLREAKEEMGLEEGDIERVLFVGGYLHPNRGDMDFSYLVFSKKPDKYFSSGDWMEKVSEKEHKGLVRVASYEEVQILLNEGRLPENPRRYDLMYSTRGALQSVRPGELAK